MGLIGGCSMDKSLLKKAAIQSVALMLAVVTLSYALDQYQMVTIAASNILSEDTLTTDYTASTEDSLVPLESDLTKDITAEQMNTPVEVIPNLKITSLEVLKSTVDESILQKMGENFLVIKKPEANILAITLDDLYVNKSIRLELTGMTGDTLTSDMISRVRGDEVFTGEPIFDEIISIVVNDEEGTSEEVITKNFGKDLSHGITVTSLENTVTKLYTSQVLIELDSVYAYILYEDANYYFIDLRKPSEVYDKILVIDAGHGGKDAGALSIGEAFYEKNINLDIVMHLKALLDKENIKVYYTRTTDTTIFLRPRVTLANAVDCDYFISIHCNANVLTSPSGTDVLFYDNEFKGVSAAKLADLFSDEIAKTVTLRQRGSVEKHLEDVFIMDKSLVPMILIEVGYLTNSSDMLYLSNSMNRKAVAQGIYNGIMRSYNELTVTKEGQ